MGYLVIGIAIGIIVDRYMFPVFDMFLEMLTQWVTKICTMIQIETNIKSLEYQELADKGNQLTPVVGYLADGQYQDEYEDDEDDRNHKSRIGFIEQR